MSIWPFRSKPPPPVDSGLFDSIWSIGWNKRQMPDFVAAQVSSTGLYVQMRSLIGGDSSLQAGPGKWVPAFTAIGPTPRGPWEVTPSDAWKVKKYKPGKWELLVEPTRLLADWLLFQPVDERGQWLPKPMWQCQTALTQFGQTAEMVLPELQDPGDNPTAIEFARIRQHH